LPNFPQQEQCVQPQSQSDSFWTRLVSVLHEVVMTTLSYQQEATVLPFPPLRGVYVWTHVAH